MIHKGAIVISETVLVAFGVIISFVLLGVFGSMIFSGQSEAADVSALALVAKDIAWRIDDVAAEAGGVAIVYNMPKGINADIHVDYKRVDVEADEKSYAAPFQALMHTKPYTLKNPQHICIVKNQDDMRISLSKDKCICNTADTHCDPACVVSTDCDPACNIEGIEDRVCDRRCSKEGDGICDMDCFTNEKDVVNEATDCIDNLEYDDNGYKKSVEADRICDADSHNIVDYICDIDCQNNGTSFWGICDPDCSKYDLYLDNGVYYSQDDFCDLDCGYIEIGSGIKKLYDDGVCDRDCATVTGICDPDCGDIDDDCDFVCITSCFTSPGCREGLTDGHTVGGVCCVTGEECYDCDDGYTWDWVNEICVISSSTTQASYVSKFFSNRTDMAVVSGEILIKLKSSASEVIQSSTNIDRTGRLVIASVDSKNTGIISLDFLNQKASALKMNRIVPKDTMSSKKFNVHDWYTVEFSNTKKITRSYTEIKALKNKVDEYLDDPNVEYAELNYVLKLSEVPDDPYYSSYGTFGDYPDLWGLKAINSKTAWDKTTGSNSILVGVIDTGIDRTHEDLNDNMWVNTGEIPDNSIDDDGNGYVDDYYGWDWVNDDNDPMDDHGHGTHCAGTIAAVGNNNLGVVGVSWDTSIMALKFLNSDGYGSVSDAAIAITYAVDMGADISSNSWGSFISSRFVSDAIEYAHDKGMILVVAAGNSNLDALNTFPASDKYVMAVAAIDYNNNKADFSNYGPKIDVAAPGVDILSTKAAVCPMCSDKVTVGTNYCHVSGTSMATPHVAGLAALILSVNPDLTNEEVRQIIRTGAKDLGTVGKDPLYGYGLIDAGKSLSLASKRPLSPFIKSPVMDTKYVSGNIDIYGSVPGPNFKDYFVEIGVGDDPENWIMVAQSSNQVIDGLLGTINIEGLENGVYTIRLTARNTDGNSYEFHIYSIIIHLPCNSPEHTLYVADTFDSAFVPGSDVFVIDTLDDQIVNKIHVGSGVAPWSVAVSPDKKYVYVGASVSDDTFYAVDTKTNEVVSSIPLGGIPSDIAVTDDGKYVYMSLKWFNDGISVIDTSDFHLIQTITGLTNEPVAITITPDSKYIYVANHQSVSVIRTFDYSLVKEITLDGSLSDITISRDGSYVLVADAHLEKSNVYVIDTKQNSVIKVITDGGTGIVDVEISTDGEFGYAITYDYGVLVIDMNDYSIVDVIPLLANAETSVLSPDGKYIYTSHPFQSSITVFDVEKRELVDKLKIDGRFIIGISVIDRTLYCASYGDIDSDESVTAEDSFLVNSHLTGKIVLTDIQAIRADINNNGRVDIGDLAAISAYVAGRIDTFPICSTLRNSPCASYGDMTDDSYVTAEDSFLVNNHLTGKTVLTDIQEIRADVNNNGRVDIGDSAAISAYVNKRIDIFPICSTLRNSPCASYGDITDDSYVTSEDSLLVNNHLTGKIVLTDIQVTRADINNNGRVDIGDLAAISAYVAERIDTFPVCNV